jgi:protein-S-isoprenylcysteine O-methyltransferase Ste14
VPPLKAVTGKAVRLFFVAVSIATFLYPLTELIFGVGLHREPMALAGMAGVILMVSGRVLTTVAVFTIRARNSQEGEDFFLHTEGVYRYSRNPIQLGLYLLLVGMAAVYWNPLFVAGIVVYTVYMHVILLREERFLQQQFKEKYAEYVEQTGRYL